MNELPTSCRAAKAVGADFFFTGKPCCHGHVAKRYISGSCFECKAEYRAANRINNAEYARSWRLANPETCKKYHDASTASGYNKEYYQRMRAAKIASAIKWRIDHPEQFREIARNYYKNNREMILKRAKKYTPGNLARQRKYREADRDKFRAKSKSWRKAHPDRARISDTNKKAMRKGADGRHTRADIESLFRLQNEQCTYCETQLSEYHVDHIKPICKGGSNWPSNLQLLCPTCNMRKYTSDHMEFLLRLGRDT